MVCYRKFIKYLYPKPRRKTMVVLSLIAIVFIFFSVQRTTHRKHIKNTLWVSHQNLSPDTWQGDTNFGGSFNSIENKDETKQKVEPEVEFVPKSRFESMENVYNITFEPSRSVLVFTGSETSNTKDQLKALFRSMKIVFDFLTWNKMDDNYLTMPRFIDKYGHTRYQTFIFTDENIYDDFDGYNWELVKRHCQRFNIGIIILCHPVHTETIKTKQLTSLPLTLIYGVNNLKTAEIPSNDVLKLVKSPNVLKGDLPGKRHVLFHSKHPTFKTLMMTDSAFTGGRKRRDTGQQDLINFNEKHTLYSISKSAIALYDQGLFDGVRKFIFGVSFWESWLYQLVLMDCLQLSSNGFLGNDLQRYIQIDVDDIFVGKTGKRLVKEDVQAMIEAQEYLSTKITNFKFNIGYSGQRYQLSNDSREREGDAYLMQSDVHKHFRWFCHTSNHIKPHQFSRDELIKDFEWNKKFAERFGLDVDHTYAVAPHHSGVYPVHDALYKAWQSVYGIQVTSTEGYPHLKPAYGRKGFLYEDIMVLPRQTCGLFTKTLSAATHPKGPTYLYDMTQGGELFWTILFNPILIFMTHMNNYGMKERLALSVFKNVTDFVDRWTNLRMQSIPPVEMANKYFELFPKQIEPLWTDPCDDLRHQLIWNHTNKYCIPDKRSTISRLPDVLILGPQKTGTTALLTFLAIHPDIVTSVRSNHSFEEIQFFNKRNYKFGLDWYLNFFPETRKSKDLVYIDKSANYFDSLKAPLRASSFLPQAKLVVILIDPRLRAYSWFQHMRSKSPMVPYPHTFYEVISTKNLTNDHEFDMLTAKCLLPGRYAESIERWLQYYDSSKLLVLDGDELKHKPIMTMSKVQTFLRLSPYPFHKHITYSSKKKYFCRFFHNKHYCLGKGKGRDYGKMTGKEWQFLSNYYHLPNLKLYDLLKKLGKIIPVWLQKEIDLVQNNKHKRRRRRSV
eukprot:TCONS_00000215-protein